MHAIASGAPFPQFQAVEHATCTGGRTERSRPDGKAFEVQPNAGTGPQAPCSGNTNDWTFYNLAAWQQTAGEDLHSVVQNPGFNNPAYPADDYTLPKGSPGAGFVVFDPNQAGRSNPVIKPPTVPATAFRPEAFNPATDF